MSYFNCFTIILFILFCIFTNLQQTCTTNTQLNKLSICIYMLITVQIKFSMMTLVPSSANSSQNSLLYQVNYPVQLLTNSSSADISSLICNYDIMEGVQKIDVSNTGNSVQYRVQQQKSSISLLLFMKYTSFKWNDFGLNVLVFRQSLYPSIVVGELSKSGKYDIIVVNDINFTTSLSASIPQTYTQTKTSTLAFINGLTMFQLNSSNFEYQVSLTQQININLKQYNVTIAAGQNTNISQIYLNYIIFNPNANEYQISSSYATFTQITSTKTQYMGNSVSSTNYILVGINSIKIKRGSSSLYLEFRVKEDGQNQLQILSRQPVNILKIGIFRIGNTPANLCNSCGAQNIVQNYGSITSCVTSCDIGTATQMGSSGLSKCLLCPTELLMVADNKGGCSCQTGYTVQNGVCQAQTTSSIRNTDYLPTFSTIDCPDQNSYINSLGKCVCVQGFIPSNGSKGNQCTAICQNGYYNGQICISCPVGYYGWNQQQTCYPCTSYCYTCLSQFSCKLCQTGFQVTHPQNLCQQICGDGINITTPCDDGNNISGDGCSSTCQIQDGYTCQTQMGGTRSICTKQTLTIQRKNISFSSGCLKIDYTLSPPPTRQYSSQQLTNSITLNFQPLSPYQTYMLHNPNDLSDLRIISTFGVMPPISITVSVTINFSEFNNGIFNDTATFNPSPTLATFARRSYETIIS